jgi:hypothetical protein
VEDGGDDVADPLNFEFVAAIPPITVIATTGVFGCGVGGF